MLFQLLCLIEVARFGLAEKEIPALLGNPAEGSPAPLATWASLRLALKPYLRAVRLWTHTGPVVKVRFFHDQFSQVSELVLCLVSNPKFESLCDQDIFGFTRLWSLRSGRVRADQCTRSHLGASGASKESTSVISVVQTHNKIHK